MTAVSRRNTVFSAMNDLGSLAHPKPLPFLSAPEVVELHYLTRRRCVVVGQYAAVGVLTLPQVLLPVHAALTLYDKSVRLALPFLCDDGVQLIFDAVDYLAFPSPECQQAVIERGAAVGTDVEMLAVLFYGLHNLARAGAAVHPGTPDVNVVRLEI